MQWKKESIFNKWCKTNWMSACRRMQIDPYLSPCTKLKNLIEERVGNSLECVGTGYNFLNRMSITQALR